MTTERVSITIGAKDKAKGVFKGVSAQFRSMTGQAFAFKGVMAGLGTALAGRQLIRFAKGSIEAFAKQEQAVVGLNAALQQTGRFSADASKLIQDQASALQRVTTIGDEALMELSFSRFAELRRWLREILD